ncbi:hypothetical protein [Rhodopirellula sp. MGV]|uniref:hypothetical protein n=1 Tax=Rhodopirellula sp. MGV TaxID=2023130 RepID=UPI000B9737E2|nr:hypothetical protein [Rhodopirellula sp. MGV]OYP39094.1 hypothetical protein CGZ80_00120 [Rhodopirellula sp. MGV]PNY35529.1 hypothetical protein C2E31_18725 [Rhodopirellula baltica]
MPDFSDAELTAFLDEALCSERSSELESQLRHDEGLRNRLVQVSGRESAGLHTLAAIWQRKRLSCPSREELGQHLLGILSDDQAGYIDFHLQTIGCRYCAANLEDLQSASAEADRGAVRRRKYFQTSAGYLRKP